MVINVWRDPYDIGVNITSKKQIDLKPGLTVLVGCNGAGKTTFLNNIKEQMSEEHIPCHLFNNLESGGHHGFFDMYFSGLGSEDDLGLGCLAYSSSEGENIKLNLGQQAKQWKKFIHEGYFKDPKNKLVDAVLGIPEVNTDKRVLLFDAVDSGMSIDAVVEIKNVFHKMICDARVENKDLYIVISANEFELCRGEECLDVQLGNYKTFWTYPKFHTFIIDSRRRKDARIKRQIEIENKRSEKEKIDFNNRKVKFADKVYKARERYKEVEDVYKRHSILREIEWEYDSLSDFVRMCRVNNFNDELHKLNNYREIIRGEIDGQKVEA